MQRRASKSFYKVRKSQIRKFLGPFRYRNCADFLGMPVRKSENPQIYTKYCANLSQSSPKDRFLHDFILCTNFN